MSDSERRPGPLEGRVVERGSRLEPSSRGELEVRIASELLERAKSEGVSLVGQATRRRGHFPDSDAALKVLYLVIQDHRPNRSNPTGKTNGWTSVINALKLYYEDRITLN